ncbi:MAG: hypothetical protein ABIE03_04870 [Patescibacteria group bacterium]|nr:hypothetical protein [Patescibacteria group bacterium]
MDTILKKLEARQIKPEKAAKNTLKDKRLLSQLFEGLKAKPTSVKYGSSKALLLISETEPQLLYPKFETFKVLLENENNIFKWTAAKIIGNLAAIDVKNKVDKKMISRLANMLNTGKMITANNAIYTLGKIAASKHKFQNKITEELLKVENYKYATKECNNIAIGLVIDTLQSFGEEIENNPQVSKFIKRQRRNKRKSKEGPGRE